jgi:hypothetical protein
LFYIFISTLPIWIEFVHYYFPISFRTSNPKNSMPI